MSIFRNVKQGRKRALLLLLAAFCVCRLAVVPVVRSTPEPHPQPSDPPFGFCAPVDAEHDAANIARRVTATTRVDAESEFKESFWGRVSFAPVPAFRINTHDPIHQDIFISGSVHGASKPWDHYIWSLFLRALADTPRGLVVDVGANLGYFSLMAAALGHDVIAFEPMGRNMAKLQASVAANPHFDARITLYQNAVSSQSSGAVSLQPTHPTNQGNGRMRAADSRRGVYGVDYVDLLRLDDILLTADGAVVSDVILMKIDVEGMEAGVLDGARRLLCARAVRYIVMEFSDETRQSTRCPAFAMLQRLQELGYAISDVTDGAPPLSAQAATTVWPPNLLLTRLPASTAQVTGSAC